jgi:hypothetical protein
MFVYESYDYKTEETDTITGKNVIELCATILSYSNNKINNEIDTEYTVSFIDGDDEEIVSISEAGLYFAITGTSITNDDVITNKMKEDSEKFWEITHSNVKCIEFSNPLHFGRAIWDEEYEEDDEDEEDDDEDYNEINTNKQKSC